MACLVFKLECIYKINCWINIQKNQWSGFLAHCWALQTFLKNPESMIRPCILVTSFWYCSFHVTYTCTAPELQPKWFNKSQQVSQTKSPMFFSIWILCELWTYKWFHTFHGHDEFNKLACSQHMGLHSSVGGGIAALMQRPWVRIPLKPQKHSSGLIVIA